MDLGITRDMFDSFVQYQNMMHKVFMKMQRAYKFKIINGDRAPDDIYEELKSAISKVLSSGKR